MKQISIFTAIIIALAVISCKGSTKQPKVDTLWDEVPANNIANNADESNEVENEYHFPVLLDSTFNVLLKTSKSGVYYENKDWADSMEFISLKPTIGQNLDSFIVIDTVQYILSYKAKLKMNPTISNATIHDVQRLEIGRHTSKTYSYLLFQGDSTSLAYRKKGASSAPWFQEPVSFEVIYKNYPSGKLTLAQRMYLVIMVPRYEETMPKFDWKISGEQKKILSYTCKKATADFRGRSYTVWFTEALPYSDGPWKFSGLPGVVLEAQDSDGYFSYRCADVSKPQTTTTLNYWQWDYKNTTRKKLLEFLPLAYSFPLIYFDKMGINMHAPDWKENYQIPYNPMELE